MYSPEMVFNDTCGCQIRRNTYTGLKSTKEGVVKHRLLLRSSTGADEHELDEFLQWHVARQQVDSWTVV